MLQKLIRQFIELCILLGCDYLEPCKGIGPKTALKLIREHGSLGEVVKFIRGKMGRRRAKMRQLSPSSRTTRRTSTSQKRAKVRIRLKEKEAPARVHPRRRRRRRQRRR
jgi:5'-3' exonuclease